MLSKMEIECMRQIQGKQQKSKIHKQKIHTMDTILAIMGVSIMLFTITMIVLFCIYQSVPDTLITCFFACCGSESGFMAVIMVAKKITEGKYLDEEA